MNKYSATGALIGIAVGIALYFIFPDLLTRLFEFDQKSRPLWSTTPRPFSIRYGSQYQPFPFLPAILGLIGWFLGFIISKLRGSG